MKLWNIIINNDSNHNAMSCLMFCSMVRIFNDQLRSNRCSGPCSAFQGSCNIEKHCAIARTTGENLGVTRLTTGLSVGSWLNHSWSSCCCRNHVLKRKMGSVVSIAVTSSETVVVRESQVWLLLALTPCILWTGMSGNTKGDSGDWWATRPTSSLPSPSSSDKTRRISPNGLSFFCAPSNRSSRTWIGNQLGRSHDSTYQASAV